MHKCPYADEYKAQRPPTCDGGKVCAACQAKWDAEQARKRDDLRRPSSGGSRF